MGHGLEPSSGELGDGTNSRTNRPEQIVASGVAAIAAGLEHSLFLKNDGSLWAMGYNFFGQLGDGTTDHGLYTTNLPEQIVAGSIVPPSYKISAQLLSGGGVQLSLRGPGRNGLRAGSFLQPVTGQLGAAGDQSRRRGRGAGAHQHAQPGHQQFLARPLRAVTMASWGTKNIPENADPTLCLKSKTESKTMKTKRNLIQICLLCAVLFQAAASGAQTVTKIAAGQSTACFSRVMAAYGPWATT
jgi:hypothetical protein